MEKFDLVNEKDEVIGETDKLTSHLNGGIHRVIAIFVFDKTGKLYLQEHVKSGELFDHSVGGHIKKGEGYDQAAQREGREELGLNCDLNFVTKFYSDETYSGKNIRHVFGVFECTPEKTWNFTSNTEVKNIIPMRISEIVKLMNTTPTKFTPGFLNTMREYIVKKNIPLTINDYRSTILKYNVLKG